MVLERVARIPFEIGDALFQIVNLRGGVAGFRSLCGGVAEVSRDLFGGFEPGIGQRGFDLRVQSLEGFAIFRLHLGGVDGDLRGTATREDAIERIVVALADGVEFVIVAARAGDGEAQEGFADYVDLVVDGLDLVVEGIDRLEAVFHEAELRGAEDRFIDAVGIDARMRQEVASQMFADELVHRHVGIQRANHVVAIAPGFANLGVAFAAVGLGVAHKIEPVPRPVLAETGRGQRRSVAFWIAPGES